MTATGKRLSPAARPWIALIALAATVPIVAAAGWMVREWSFSIPCEERGPYDCAIDGGVYAAVLAILGFGLVGVTALFTWAAKRFSRVSWLVWVPLVLGWAGWITLSSILLTGAGST